MWEETGALTKDFTLSIQRNQVLTASLSILIRFHTLCMRFNKVAECLSSQVYLQSFHIPSKSQRKVLRIPAEGRHQERELGGLIIFFPLSYGHNGIFFSPLALLWISNKNSVVSVLFKLCFLMIYDLVFSFKSMFSQIYQLYYYSEIKLTVSLTGVRLPKCIYHHIYLISFTTTKRHLWCHHLSFYMRLLHLDLPHSETEE